MPAWTPEYESIRNICMECLRSVFPNQTSWLIRFEIDRYMNLPSCYIEGSDYEAEPYSFIRRRESTRVRW